LLAAARHVWRAAELLATRLAISFILIGSVGASVVACRSGNGERLGERVIPLGQPVPKGGGTYLTGPAYQVDGVWYQPREDPTYDRIGTASWYGELFHGRRTANGEIYDMDRLSAASPTLPLPVYARVTNLENHRSIIVRVNDRGPYANDRIMDLSRRSAELLGFRDKGTALVRVQYLARAPLNGDDSYERRYLVSQSLVQVASRGVPKEPVSVGSLAANGRPPVPVAYRNPTAVAAAPLPPPIRAMRSAAPKLRWQASARATPQSRLSRHENRGRMTTGRFVIQAGSFRSTGNAERARSFLSGIGPVEVALTEVGGETIFCVLVGPFAEESAATAALARAREAGYGGAKIVAN
jgi:rare lipoprotein A